MDDKDDIEMENDSRNGSREDDPDYDAEMEEDKVEFEDQDYDELPRSMDRFEHIADSALTIQKDEMMVSPLQTQVRRQVSITSEVEKKSGSKRKRGRGPTKGIKVTEPMHLEYNNLGQPCGRWRGKYGTQIGLCIRKLSILWSWREVPKDLKEELWEDTMNLFHIQPDEAKKDVFLSAVAERFRDFKSKLVSGWITYKRDRTQAKKMRKEKEPKGKESENKERRENKKGKVEEEEQHEKENEEGIKKALEKKQAPELMPYEIWDHISKDDWEAFVAKKTAPHEIEKRDKASINANKKYFHHMGPKTFDEKRKEWINEGFYPNLSSSLAVTSSSPITAVKVDRVADWYCSLHGLDASGRRAVVDPAVRKVADEVIGWKHKEATGEFTPRANMDALYMVLGKEHKGRVKGKGGVRLGEKKAFGEEYSATRISLGVNAPQDLEAIKAGIKDELMEKMEKQVTNILERMGFPCLDSLHAVTEDKLSQQDPSTPVEVLDETLKPPVLELEESPCHLLLPKSGLVCDELVEVAYGRAQPPREDQKVHMALIAGYHLSVCIDTVVSGFEHFSLPVPRWERNLHSLADAQDNFVTWPCAWVRFSIEKIKKVKTKNLSTKKEGLQENKEDSRSKKTDSQVKGKCVSSHANDKEVDSKAMGKKGDSKSKEKKIDSQSEDAEMQKLSSNCSNPLKTKAIPLVDDEVLQSLSKACLWLHICVMNLLNEEPSEDLYEDPTEGLLHIILDKFQFNFTVDMPISLYKLDIRLFLDGEHLESDMLQVFMSALYEDLNGRESLLKVGWLSPGLIDDYKCLESQLKVKKYIETGILESIQAGNKFIIAPYNEDNHWLLLVISPSTRTIYQFDSDRQEPPRNLLIKSLLNSVMRKVSGGGLQRATLPRWKSMKCAQQMTCVDPGYYVMRYMYDLVSCCFEVDDLEKMFNSPRETPFLAEEINEVRDKVAWFLTDNCF